MAMQKWSVIHPLPNKNHDAIMDAIVRIGGTTYGIKRLTDEIRSPRR